MAKEKVIYRNRVFHYKVARVVPADSAWTLQKALEGVFAAIPKPAARMQVLAGNKDADADTQVVIWRQTYKGMLCGIAQRFREGAMALGTLISEDAENFDIVQLAPPQQEDEKIRAEFSKTILHFGIYGNHVVLTEPRGLESEGLENHFSWLLAQGQAKAASGARTTTQVLLDDYIPPKYRDRPINNVRGITLQPTSPAPIHKDKPKGNSPEAIASRAIIEDDPLIETLIEFFRKHLKGSKQGVEDLEKAFQKGQLNASVSLNIRGGNKEHSLDAIAGSMRHVTDLNYEITLPHEEPLKSSQTKITRSYSVKMNHDVPEHESIFGRMTNMLASLSDAGEIDGDA